MRERPRRPDRTPGHRLARLLVRGPDAPFILDDLAEMYARDRERGVTPNRACWRYARDVVRSALSIWRARLRRPRLPGVSWLDVKLAGRMLVKHPALTLVGVFALAIGIPVALAPLQMHHVFNTPLPFDEGDRILGLQYRFGIDSREARPYDFERWRRDLQSFAPLAAARTRVENLVSQDGRVELVRGAEMTASAFAVVRVRSLLGRLLVEADEAPGAPPVVVIGYGLWQSRFAGDRDVIGRTLQFGRTRRTVVGVMPEGFLFPYRDRFWTPFQVRAFDHEVGSGPRLWVFGRLRDGVSKEQAHAELRLVARRVVDDYPETHEHPMTHERLEGEVVPYAHHVTGMRAEFARLTPIFLMTLLLLVVACGNVGTLMLARTAGRANEIAVRNALGAARGRIVLQLFVEALVLALLAAAIGLGLAHVAIGRMPLMSETTPSWFDWGIDPFAAAVAFGLATFSAVIAGLLPAVKATGRSAYLSLQRTGTGMAGVRFGAAATVLIVMEVAIAVGGLSGAVTVARSAFRDPSVGSVGEGIAAEEYLAVRLRVPADASSTHAGDPIEASADSVGARFEARLREIQDELFRRLASEPAVRATTFASVLPGMDHERAAVEVEGEDPGSRPARGYTIRTAHVDSGFFDALGHRVLAGRGFESEDLRRPARSVIVNRSLVDQVLRGRAAVGRRIRYVVGRDEQPGPWHEIIGVVDDLGMNIVQPDRAAGVYHVAEPGEVYPPQLLVQVRGEPLSFVARLRTILSAIEPTAVIENPARLDAVFSELRWEARFSSAVFLLIAAIAVVLSAAGLYALMAFTVTQRTREIGIRVALGARPARIAVVILRRALLQLGAGVAIGAWIAIFVVPDAVNDEIRAVDPALALLGVSIVMIGTGLLACVAPTRRAFRIQPVQALKTGE